MKIVFIVDTFPSLSETFILNQITGLIERGHDVYIFALSRPEDRDFHRDISDYNLLKKTYYLNDKPSNRFSRLLETVFLFFYYVWRFPKTILNSLNIFKYGRDAFSLSYFYKVILFLSLGPFDILMCHYGHNGDLAVRLHDMGVSGKIVTMFHGYDIRRGLSEGGDIYKNLFRGADKILSISNYNYESLIKMGCLASKLAYHPVGINKNRFPLKYDGKNNFKEEQKIKIVTVARLVAEKGLEDGIWAMAKLKQIMPSVNFVYQIIGDGILKQQLIIQIRQLNLEGVVSLLGPQHQDEISYSLRSSDIYFLPSIAEALPVVLMEAQAVGLPVVATSVGAVKELVLDGQAGFIVSSKDAQTMAEKISYLINHPGEREKMGRKGREHVLNLYDIEQLNLKLEKLFQELHGQSSVA